MRMWRSFLGCGWLLLAWPFVQGQSVLQDAGPDSAQVLLTLANQARNEAGVGPLHWDGALAAAALQHCRRMAVEGPLSHDYPGEPALTARAAAAGAHFSLIEENIAVGASAAEIQGGWLNSAGHRKNMLNPAIDRIGVAVVVRQGLLYAVADYARAVPVLSRQEVEATFAGLLRGRHLRILRDPGAARAYCESGGKYRGLDPPQLLMRWENPDVGRLPEELAAALEHGAYQYAAVGSCPAREAQGGFTTYRVAVLLY